MEELHPDTLGELEQTAEVHPFPRRRSGSVYEQAKQDLAAFKFALFETVAADPLLRGVPCLNLIVVYASLVTIDKRTLQPTTAYASNARIYSRAGLKSHHTAGKARRYLEQYGYIVPVGSNNGITIYRLENPNIERVQDYVHALDEHRREVRADKKQSWNEQRRRMAKNATPDNKRVAEVAIPENNEGGNICHPGVAEVAIQGWQEMPSNTFNKYLSGIPHNNGTEEEGSLPDDVVRGICEEGAEKEGERSAQSKSAVASSPDYIQQDKKKENEPVSENFGAAMSEQEAERRLLNIFGAFWNELHPNIQRYARIQLLNGRLTQSWVDERIARIEAQSEIGDA